MPSIFNSSTSLITSGLVDKECCFTSLVLFDFQSPQSLNLKVPADKKNTDTAYITAPPSAGSHSLQKSAEL